MAKFVGFGPFAFSGKLGNVVGRMRDGKCYISQLPEKRKMDSPMQLDHQAKFKLVALVLRTLNPLLKITFAKPRLCGTGVNHATSYTLKNAINEKDKPYSIDWPRLKTSIGPLRRPMTTTTSVVGNQMMAQWDFNHSEQQNGNSHPEDIAILAVYCPDLNRWHYELKGSRYRCATKMDVKPFAGHTLHCYLSFMSDDPKQFSDSVYLGEIQIPQIKMKKRKKTTV